MKWFKHYSNAMSSNTLTELRAQHGLKGLARYWLLLELMCQKFDGDEDMEFVFSIKDLKEIMETYHTRSLIDWLQSLSNLGLMSFESTRYVVRISSPILLKLQSRDFKKARFDRAPSAPKNKNKNKNKNICSIPQPIERLVNEIYSHYPRKLGKKNGVKKLTSLAMKNEKMLDDVKKAVSNYVAHCEANKVQKEYMPYFSTFVNSYEDWVDYQPEGGKQSGTVTEWEIDGKLYRVDPSQ